MINLLRTRTSRVGHVLSLCLVAACAGPADDDNGEDPAGAATSPVFDEIEDTDTWDKVWQGVPSTEPTVIGISALNSQAFNCSGSALTNRVIVTAGHCVPSNNATCSGFPCRTGTMRFFRATGALSRVFVDRSVQVFRNENYTHQDDADDDIALIVLDTPYNNLSPVLLSLNSVPVSTILHAPAGWGTVSQYSFVEDGYQHAPPGNKSFGVDWTNGNYFIDDNDDDVRLCRGDSGGPAFRLVTSLPGNPYGLAGVLHGGDVTAGRLCAVGGTKLRWTAVLPKVDWLEIRMRAVGTLCPTWTGPCCTRVAGGAAAQCF